jgi:uncharacterized protein
MIVDSHTHWGPCYKTRDGLNPSQWLAGETRHGVTHAVVAPFLGLHDDTLLQQENEDLAKVCDASGGRMIPFCTVNPYRRDTAVAEFRRCVEVLKMRGLKIHPWVQGTSLNGESLDELCEMAAHWNIPLLFHDGTPSYSLPSQMALLARRHPSTTMILGHCGLYEHWREAICAMRYAENLWGCLCGPHLAALREIVRRSDRQRLLWGTDYGASDADVVGHYLGLFKLLRLADQDFQRIVEHNPRRLFGSALAS